MAWTLVQGTNNNSGSSPVTATFTNTPAQGNLIVISISSNSPTNITSVQDGNSNNATALAQNTSATGKGGYIYGYIAGASQSKAFTVTLSGKVLNVNIYEFSGNFAATNGNAASFIDNGQVSQTTFGTAAQSSTAMTLTATNSGSMAFATAGFIATVSSPSWTTTSQGQATPSGAIELFDGYQGAIGTSAYNATASWTTSRPWVVCMVLFAPASGFTRKQQATANDTTFASSVTATFTNALTAGSIIMLGWIGEAATGTNKANTPTDTAGNTYVRLNSQFKSGVFDLEMWYAQNSHSTASNAVHVTDTIGGTNNMLVIEEWTGQASSSVSDGVQQGLSSTSGTTATSGSMTTTNANDMIWAVCAFPSSSATLTAGTGYSSLTQPTTDGNSAMASESKVVSSTGAQAATMTSSVSTSWIILQVAISNTPISSGNTKGIMAIF